MGEDARIRGTYRLRASDEALDGRIRALVLEQTVELPDAAVRDPALRAAVLGRVESVHRESDSVHHVSVSWPAAVLDGSVASLLNVLFGNSSLHDDVVLVHLEVPEAMRGAFGGPRCGVAGLRGRLDARDRVLTCTALKPVGLGVEDLARLAGTFAEAGIDVVKDDHGLTDQASAPFEDRVRACVRAVRDAEQRTGRRTLYAPNVCGGPAAVVRGVERARELGADAVLLQPALLGLPAFAEIARAHADLPILGHPALAGVAGIAPEAMLGRLFRLLGADAVIFPHAGGRFGWSDRTCARIGHGLVSRWDPLRPSLPVPAGGMRLDRIEELVRFYGRDVMLLVGGHLYLAFDRIADRAREFVEAVHAA